MYSSHHHSNGVWFRRVLHTQDELEAVDLGGMFWIPERKSLYLEKVVLTNDFQLPIKKQNVLKKNINKRRRTSSYDHKKKKKRIITIDRKL